MKFGCCTNILPRQQGSVGEEYLPILAELGYDYVELPLDAVTGVLTDSQRKDLRKIVADTLPVNACNNFFISDIKLCGPDRTPTEVISDYIKRALFNAAALGARIAVFGSPWSKACPEGFPKSEAFKQLIDTCHIIGEEASKCGITVAIEPNNTLETNMINTYRDVLSLVNAVGHPHIQGMQDYFHLKQEKDTVDDMINGADHLVHTHFARYEGRRYPKSADEDAYYPVFFKALRDIGYNGGMTIEAYVDDRDAFRQDAADTLRFFKEMQ